MPAPSEKDARLLVEKALGANSVAARRFPTGLCHYVYEVELTDGRRVVARLAGPHTQQFLAGDVYWQARLRPLGVPLPALLHADLSAPIPHVLFERIPGSDLGIVYSTLDNSSKRAVAAAVVDAQMRVSRLPEAPGFGHALSYEDPALDRHQSWKQVITASLERSRQHITSAGVVDVAIIDRISPWLRKFEAYFSRVRPTPFLADATTKNVIVYQGRLTGIVDIDEVCFGDPLLTVGLTQMSLLALGADTDYVSHWLELLETNAEGRAVADFYTVVFCADFISEQGQSFNREQVPVDAKKVALLQRILDDLLSRL
jgi:hypothetical protein